MVPIINGVHGCDVVELRVIVCGDYTKVSHVILWRKLNNYTDYNVGQAKFTNRIGHLCSKYATLKLETASPPGIACLV